MLRLCLYAKTAEPIDTQFAMLSEMGPDVVELSPVSPSASVTVSAVNKV